ncbi:MAG: SPOR domain-containing protein [Magnetococcales bacterium]|nr:SPOR domain-containing protein [Magnetococcales bacterium]
MPPLVLMIPRFVPFVVLAVLAGLNVCIFLFMSTTSQDSVWVGPPLPGKRLALAALVPEAEVPVVTPEAAPAKAEKKEAAKKKAAAPAADEGEFIVQAGGFLDLGTNVMLERLRKGGLDPWVDTTQEVVRLNDVQAGPFANQKDAKEAEAQLKAAGIVAKVEETWEGFVISLSRNYALGDALQELEKAQSLGLSAVRLVKVEEERAVRRVCVGPFPNKDKAKEISARVAKIGMTVPVIKEWTPRPGHTR